MIFWKLGFVDGRRESEAILNYEFGQLVGRTWSFWLRPVKVQSLFENENKNKVWNGNWFPGFAEFPNFRSAGSHSAKTKITRVGTKVRSPHFRVLQVLTTFSYVLEIL